MTYTVTVDFEKVSPRLQPARTTERPVRGPHGQGGEGALIDGADPDVLDYTIRIGANDPGAYILPEAPSG
ncbi:MAG: hypothetical protein ACLS6O_00040 [Bifidobacterium sp.]